MNILKRVWTRVNQEGDDAISWFLYRRTRAQMKQIEEGLISAAHVIGHLSQTSLLIGEGISDLAQFFRDHEKNKQELHDMQMRHSQELDESLCNLMKQARTDAMAGKGRTSGEKGQGKMGRKHHVGSPIPSGVS